MASLLRSRGWVESDAASAELRIVNTCSVTMEAASKSRQAVRREIRRPSTGEGQKVVVTGCWATSDKNEALSIPGVDSVITHHDNVAERIGELAKTGEAAGNPLPLLNHRQPRQRAFLKIQDGCDAHCTYCIIPKLRPVLRSKPIEDLVTEARQLVDAGHVETLF